MVGDFKAILQTRLPALATVVLITLIAVSFAPSQSRIWVIAASIGLAMLFEARHPGHDKLERRLLTGLGALLVTACTIGAIVAYYAT